MNPLYLSLLRMNALRFIKCNMIWPYSFALVIFFIGFHSSLNATGRMADGGAIFMFAITILFAFVVSVTFWQYGWSVGNVDALTGLQTEKFQRDRLFLGWMSCLPLSRKKHYTLQMLLYIIICMAITALSFLVQSVLEFGKTYTALAIYIHLLLFIALMLAGGYQVTVSLPYTYKHGINSFKSPIVIRGLLIWVVFIFLISQNDSLYDYFSKETLIDFTLTLSSYPIILAALFFISILLFWIGASKFISSDIR